MYSTGRYRISLASINYINRSTRQWYMLSIIPKSVTVATRTREYHTHTLFGTGKPTNTSPKLNFLVKPLDHVGQVHQ